MMKIPPDVPAEEIYQTVKAALTADSLNFQALDEGRMFRLPFKGTPVDLTAWVLCGDGYLVFQSHLPLSVPEDKLPKLLLQLNAINTNSAYGAYEFNLHTSKVVFKLGVPYPPRLEPEEILILLYRTVAASNTDAKTLLDALT
jgi:hypothetical protein